MRRVHANQDEVVEDFGDDPTFSVMVNFILFYIFLSRSFPSRLHPRLLLHYSSDNTRVFTVISDIFSFSICFSSLTIVFALDAVVSGLAARVIENRSTPVVFATSAAHEVHVVEVGAELLSHGGNVAFRKLCLVQAQNLGFVAREELLQQLAL